MSERPAIDLSDLPPEVRERFKQQGIKRPRKAPSMSRNEVRTRAIRVLAVIADLTPAERERVLSHATRLNEV